MHKRLLSSFPRISTLIIRYQKLDVIDGEALKLPIAIVSHNITQDEYNMSIQEVINKIRPNSTPYWISQFKPNNTILSCVATIAYKNINEFKTLEEQQNKEAASENTVRVTRTDIESISKVDDVISVASTICSDFEIEHDGEYHLTREYHIVENAILNVNGWEHLRSTDGGLISIENDDWLLEHKNKLIEKFPWIAAIRPPSKTLEYGIKLLTLAPGVTKAAEQRLRMYSKALRRRTRVAINGRSDMGHTFCIAMLLIALVQDKLDDDTEELFLQQNRLRARAIELNKQSSIKQTTDKSVQTDEDQTVRVLQDQIIEQTRIIEHQRQLIQQ